MQKTLLIGRREFYQKVRTRGFWLTSIGVPLVMLIIWAVTGAFGGSSSGDPAALEAADRPEQTIGYVDQADLIQTIPDAIPNDLFQPFSDIQQAEIALEGGDIAAYYVILPDYRQTGNPSTKRSQANRCAGVSGAMAGWSKGNASCSALPAAPKLVNSASSAARLSASPSKAPHWIRWVTSSG